MRGSTPAPRGSMADSVWIVNPYGSLPGETWVTYRSTMLAECLAARGYAVTQFISNFEHRSKQFRGGPRIIQAAAGYTIEVVPSTRYDAHVSAARVRYERTFGRNLVALTAGRERPTFLILAEPALFYYDVIVRELLADGHTALVLDLIDIWPELFELVLPSALRPFSGALLAPFYHWRRRLYRRADAVVAVSRDYLEIARRQVRGPDVPLEVVYWSYDDTLESSPSAPSALSGSLRELTASKTAGEVWAVYAGTLGANYDIPAILDLARDLPPRLENRIRLRFVIAGDGPLADECRRRASDSLVFTGRLGPRELSVLYQHTDFALSTYRGESTVAMPIKAFDYMRFGLPIVNSLGRDLGALVERHAIGINYKAGDPASLSAAVERLACDPQLRRTMGDNARALAPEFAASRQYPKFVPVLEAVARGRTRIP